MIARSAGMLAATALPNPLLAASADESRLKAWGAALRSIGMNRRALPLGPRAIRVGELAIGTPYEPYTLEAYIKAGGDPKGLEPLIVSLTRFDCVTLVESCLAVARASDDGKPPTWDRFSREVERMRYRGGKRQGYASRLHYFSEWISDGEKRGLVKNLGQELGGTNDTRPLRFMTEHRSSYPALADDTVFAKIGEMEKSLDNNPRWVIPTDRIESVQDRIHTGDVLAFATAIPGIDDSRRVRVSRKRWHSESSARSAFRRFGRDYSNNVARIRRKDSSLDGNSCCSTAICVIGGGRRSLGLKRGK